MSKGKYPFPKISDVRETTRRVAASFNPRAVLTRASASFQESTDTVEDEVPHVEAPEEPPTTLTRLASERPNPLADLESLLPVRHTFDDEDGFIALCNDLLVLNAQEHRDPTRRTIKIPGTTGVFISPNQFYHSWHLLSQRGRGLNGGILADEAGTGKTYVFFAACLLRALAFESERAVRLYWSGKGKKKVGRHAEHHLPEGANGRSCPSQKPGDLACYCVPGSLTRIICDHTPSGVSTIHAASETWPDILNMVQTAGLNPSMYQLYLVHNNAPARFTRPLQPLVKTLSRGAETDLKSFSPASYIFITILQSPRLRHVFSEATLNVGFSIFDEAHQILRPKDSLTFRMASEYSHHGADVWFVTATPFSGCTLGDWSAPMKLIAPSRGAAMRALDTALANAEVTGNADDARFFRAHFDVVFDRDLVVRHLGTSKFLGKPISDVQDIIPRVISRETPLQHRSAVQELANQIAYQDPRLSNPAQRGLLYLVSLFPAAAQLILDDPITFDTASIRDLVRQVKNRLRIEESEPLRRLADQIAKDSPKLDYILEELNRMNEDMRERDQIDSPNTSRFGAGEDLKMKKMVIITPTVVSAVFLYLALIRHRPDVSLIHNWVSAQEKEQTVNNFKSLSAAKLVKHTRVLIAPFAAIGTGANLQVASYEILTSPLPDKASQVQAFARTNRSGQRLRPLSHKILVLEDSPVDRIVLASHATLDMDSDPFNINEPLRITRNIELDELDMPSRVVEEQLSFSHASTLGVDEGLLLQNALPFSPRSPTKDASRETKRESGSDTSSIDTETALLILQDALSWAPGSDIDNDIQRTGGAEIEHRHSLFNGLSNDLSFTSTTGRQSEPGGSMAAMIGSGSSNGTHRQPAPRHSSMPTHHDLGHRPLPSLPTDTQSGGQNLDHVRGWPTLFPPLRSGPPVRIDVGPTLASPRNRSVSTAAPSSWNRTNDNREALGTRASGSAYPPSEAGPSSRIDPLVLRLEADFSRSTEHSLEQRASPVTLRGGQDPIDRPPTPYPDEMRENEDDNSEPDLDPGHMTFDVEHLIQIARMSAMLVENDRFEENAQDS
jgi:hypothetical protein